MFRQVHWAGECQEAVAEFGHRVFEGRAELTQQRLIGTIVRHQVIELVRYPQYPEPIGRQDLGSRLDLDCAPTQMSVPFGLNDAAASLRHMLPFERFEQAIQPLRPSALEVDILQAADAEELLEGTQLQRNDEVGILELFRQVFRDRDLLAYTPSGERLVATAQQHLERTSLKRRSKLAAPFVSGIKIEDVCKDLVAGGFEPRREPQHELVITRRRLGNENQVAFNRPAPAHLLDRLVDEPERIGVFYQCPHLCPVESRWNFGVDL